MLFAQASAVDPTVQWVLTGLAGALTIAGTVIVALWRRDVSGRDALLLRVEAELTAERVEGAKLIERNTYLTNKIEATVIEISALKVELARAQARLERYEPPQSQRISAPPPFPLPPPSHPKRTT